MILWRLKFKILLFCNFSIELASRQLACSQRVNVYAHLAAFLPCSQQTLTKRAKNLRLNGPDDKLAMRDPLQKLKDGITS